MDGRGRYLDNIFIERLWRSIKYELIYIKTFDSGIHLRVEVKEWFEWYNQIRPHQGLDDKTPAAVYRLSLAITKLIWVQLIQNSPSERSSFRA
jgi:putative transposase